MKQWNGGHVGVQSHESCTLFFCKKLFAAGHRSRRHHLCKFIATKESGYIVRVKLPQDLFNTPKWPPFTTWRTWRHVEKLYTLGKSYPSLKKPGQVTYVSLETNACSATCKWLLIREGFKVKRPFAFKPLIHDLIWCFSFFSSTGFIFPDSKWKRLS